MFRWVCGRVLDGIEFEKESGWVHMMEICLHGNSVCAPDGPWRLARKCFEMNLSYAPLLAEPLLERILCSSHSHGLLRSVEIMQESRSGSGREIIHELRDWGYAEDMCVRREVSESSNRREASSAMQFSIPG